MGCICSPSQKRSKKGSLINIKSQNDNCYYKPKWGSSSFLAYDPEKKMTKEEVLDLKGIFQAGCMLSKLGPSLYLCIGGIESSDIAFMIQLNEKKITSIPAPPMPIAYGRINKYRDKVYIIGALSSQRTSAPPLCFDLKSKKWSELPPAPIHVSLCGSYIAHTFLYLIGGFLNYPNNPNPFESLLIFDIPSDCWVQSDIKTPISNGLPNCTVLPSSDILIVGGHDPLKNFEGESNKVYLFDGKSFEQCADIPEVCRLHFFEDAMHFRSEVYLYSDNDYLFTYNIDKDTWTYQMVKEKTIKDQGHKINQI